MMLFVIFVVVIFAAAAGAVVTTPGVVLATKLGRISGTAEMLRPEDGHPGSTRFFYGFRGVPYAKPPVGHLRWKAPRPFGPWRSDLDATNFGSSCPQFERSTGNVSGDEDCLSLNIFTPHVPIEVGNGSRSRSSLMPVMVWVHGGGFVRGGSHQFGPQFLMREDVVLVTVNYRLGVLGFLSTGSQHLPGNYGMLDVIEALKWVRDHIVSFGGDPGKVTLFGESSGGAMTHMLILSPLSAGLFHGSILQSGSALCHWSVENNPRDQATRIAARLQCPGDPAAMVACLMQKEPHQLVTIQNELTHSNVFGVGCAPVVDAAWRQNPLLPQSPEDIIRSASFNAVPIIAGLNPDEGLLFYLRIHSENIGRMSVASFVDGDLIPAVIASVVRNHTEPKAVMDAIQRQYFGDVESGSLLKMVTGRLSHLMADSLFTSCVYRTQMLHASASSAPVFAYLFNYRGERTPSFSSAFADLLKRSGFNHPLIDTAITHGDELLYLFRMSGLSADYSSGDLQVSKMMTRLWSNFARFGNPVAGLRQSSTTSSLWPRVSATEDRVVYLNINPDDAYIGVDYRKAEHLFWSNVVPFVSQVATKWRRETSSTFSVVWSLLGLLLLAVVALVVLTAALVYQMRSRRYPERGVISLQRPRTVL